MPHLLVVAAAFLFDFVATYAGTKAIIAVGHRAPLRVANWGLVVNIPAGLTLFIVIVTQNLPAFFAGCAGAWLADYWATELQRRRELAERSRSAEGSRSDVPDTD